LSSSYTKELKKADQLIVHGQFKDAYELINESLKDKKIVKNDELQFLAFKSELELYFGNFSESIRLSEKILKENKENTSPLISIDALLWKAISLLFNGKFSESLAAFEKGLILIKEVTNLPVKVVSRRHAQLQTWKAFAIIHVGDFNRGLALAKEAYSFAEKSEYKPIICLNLLFQLESHWKLHEGLLHRELAENALAIATELGNNFLMAFSYFMLTRTHRLIRDFNIAEELFIKSFSLAEEAGTKLLFAAKNDFGNFYRINFQFDKALFYYHEALEISPFMRNMTNSNIAYTYYLKYDFENAQKYYLESIRYCEETKDYYILPFNLHNLVNIAIELNDLSQAKEYLHRLKELSEETGFENIDQIYRAAKISILKASGSISDLVKVAELLDSLLAEERYFAMDPLNISYSLLEIRLKELLLSPSEENLKEVRKRLHHLEVEAENGQHQWLLANVYRLQSQLSLVELDVNEAINLLNKAQIIAEEIDLELLKQEIKKDLEKIEQQLTIFHQFQEQKAPLSETLKLASLENTMNSVKQETVLEERDQETGVVIEYRKLFSLRI
jgi:tetratricopeptide (TPR) repeat protein